MKVVLWFQNLYSLHSHSLRLGTGVTAGSLSYGPGSFSGFLPRLPIRERTGMSVGLKVLRCPFLCVLAGCSYAKLGLCPLGLWVAVDQNNSDF